MRNLVFLRRMIVVLPLVLSMVIILSTNYAPEQSEVPASTLLVEDQYEFIPDGSGLRVGTGVNRGYTPPPAEYFQRSTQTATFVVNFNPASCVDDDLADVVPFPEEVEEAFTLATDIWGTLINSTVPIEIDACFRPLDPGILGSAGPVKIFSDGSTLFPVALANALAETDLTPGEADIIANFSSEFDFFFGTGNSTPASQLNFTSVVLHEIGHGLGIFGSMQVGRLIENGPLLGQWGFGGIPVSYDRFVENGANQSLIDLSIFSNPSEELYAQVTSDNLFFNGPISLAANGNSQVPLFAPAVFQQGSSFSHLGESFNGTDNALMTFSLDRGETRHSPGPVGLAVLEDIGWSQTESSDPPTAVPTNTATPVPTNTPTETATMAVTETATSAPTNIPTETATVSVSETATAVPTNTATPVPTNIPTETATMAATETATTVPTNTETPVSTSIPTETATVVGTETATSVPTSIPAETATPSLTPELTQTAVPTSSATATNEPNIPQSNFLVYLPFTSK